MRLFGFTVKEICYDLARSHEHKNQLDISLHALTNLPCLTLLAVEHLSTHNTCKPIDPCHAVFTLLQPSLISPANPLRVALEGHVDFPEPTACCVASQQLIGSRPSVGR